MPKFTSFTLFAAFLLISGKEAFAQRALDRIIGEIRQQIGKPNPQNLPGQAPTTAGQPAIPNQNPTVVQMAPQDDAGYLGLGVDDSHTVGDGVLVKDVIVGAPAQQAGVSAGDLITSINGQPVRQMEDVAQLLQGRKSGETIAVGLLRNGESIALAVLLGKKGVNAPLGKVIQGTPSVLVAPNAGGPKLGVKSRPLDDALRAHFNIPANVNGVLVIEKTAGSAAEKSGLPIGAVIISVNGQAVNSPDELGQQVRAAGTGATLAIQYWYQGSIAERQIPLGGGAAEPGATQSVLLRPTDGPRPADAESSDFIGPAPGAGSSPSALQRIQQLEAHVKELEERIKQLETRQEPRA
jgi:membrane-associated protease RseP (regulator of RpoE activity)